MRQLLAIVVEPKDLVDRDRLALQDRDRRARGVPLAPRHVGRAAADEEAQQSGRLLLRRARGMEEAMERDELRAVVHLRVGADVRAEAPLALCDLLAAGLAARHPRRRLFERVARA